MTQKVLCTILFFLVSTLVQADLTNREKSLVDAYIKTISVERSAGQLFMTGMPTDVALYQHDNVLETLFGKLGIGWAMVNSYNYYWNRRTQPNRDDILSSIAGMNNDIQTFNRSHGLNLPIGLAANFEGEKFSSITSVLTQVPEALTLATTNSNELVDDAGDLVGHQLREIGVHVLLGPVIDIDSTSSREYVTTIQNRIFGGNPELVATVGSRFLASLGRNGIMAVGKHFPGHGDVLEDPHNSVIPESQLSIQSIETSLYPYRQLQGRIQGFMTEHVAVNILRLNDNRIVTFSPFFVRDLIRSSSKISVGQDSITGLGASEALVLTDDLSDMGAIREYMKKDDLVWDEIVTQAFEAGHDIFLFANVERKAGETKFTRFRDFDIDRLAQVIRSFVSYINSSDLNKARFFNSLRRILYLKAEIAKSRGQSVEDLLAGNTDRWLVGNLNERKLDEIDTRRGPRQATVIVHDILAKSFVEFHKATDYSLVGLDPTTRICAFVDQNGFDEFGERLGLQFRKSEMVRLSTVKSPSDFARLFSQITRALKECDKVIITLASIDDSKLIESAFEQNETLARQKLVVLLHNTATLLRPSIVQKVTVLGTQSYHQQSFATDLDVLLANATPNPISNVTISIGPNGSFYNQIKTKSAFTLAEGYDQLPYFATAKEKDLAQDKRRLEGTITTLSALIGFSLVLAGLYLFVLIPLRANSKRTSVAISARLSLFWNKYPKRNVAIVVVFVILILVSVILVIYMDGARHNSTSYRYIEDSFPYMMPFIDDIVTSIVSLSLMSVVLTLLTGLILYVPLFGAIIHKWLGQKE